MKDNKKKQRYNVWVKRRVWDWVGFDLTDLRIFQV